MLAKFVKKRPGSSVWQIRVPVPADVQAEYGRREFTKSLGERDRVKADRIAVGILAELHEEFEKIRAASRDSSSARIPSNHDLDILINQTFEDVLALSRERRANRRREDVDGFQEWLERQEANQAKYVHDIEREEFARWEPAARKRLSSNGFKIEPEASWYQEFVRRFAIITVDATSVSNSRDRGALVDEPTSSVGRDARKQVSAMHGRPADWSFLQLSEEFLRHWEGNAASRRSNTVQQKRAAFRMFAGFWNDKPIRSVRESDAAKFHDELKFLDPHWARSPRAKTMDWGELLGEFGSHSDGLSVITMNRHMANLQQLWKWARKRGHCEGENPFEGFYVKPKVGVNTHPYMPWENEELRTLLEPPPRRQDLLEIILVGMFSGLRIDEVASLTWNQLRQETSDGERITYFDIEDAKTMAGRRQVPLHSELSWLIYRIEGSPPGERVWPTFNCEGPDKKPGADASRCFSEFKIRRGFTSPTKTFHSFRKCVTRMMERLRVPEGEWAQVLGHERGFTYGTYNPEGITLRQKSDLIEWISYPGVELPEME